MAEFPSEKEEILEFTIEKEGNLDIKKEGDLSIENITYSKISLILGKLLKYLTAER